MIVVAIAVVGSACFVIAGVLIGILLFQECCE